MQIILSIIAIICAGVCTVIAVNKLIKSLLNITTLLQKENFHDGTKQKHGIVYNTKTKKLEADQSLILPF